MLALWPQLLELMTQKKSEIIHLIVQMSKLTQNKLSTITHICTTTITNIIYCLWKLISKSKCPQVIILVASCRKNDCKNSDPSSASSILVCVVLEEGKVLCLFIIISRPCYQSLDVHTMVIGNIIIALARQHCTALHCIALHCQMPTKIQLPTKKTTDNTSLRNEFILWRLVTSNLSSQWLLLSLKKSSRLHKLHHKKHFLISDLGMASHDLWWRENDLPYNAFSIPIESLAIGWTCSDSGWLVCIKGKVTLQFPGHGGKPD